MNLSCPSGPPRRAGVGPAAEHDRGRRGRRACPRGPLGRLPKARTAVSVLVLLERGSVVLGLSLVECPRNFLPCRRMQNQKCWAVLVSEAKVAMRDVLLFLPLVGVAGT